MKIVRRSVSSFLFALTLLNTISISCSMALKRILVTGGNKVRFDGVDEFEAHDSL